MRLSTIQDRLAIERLVRRRSEWMRDRGYPEWRTWLDSAPKIAGMAGTPARPLWLATDAGRLQGIAGLGPPPAWLAAYRPASPTTLLLHTTVTDPAYAGLGIGAAISSWAQHHAAQVEATALLAAAAPEIADYYQRIGWNREATTVRSGRRIIVLALPVPAGSSA